ncbi:Ctf8-domain-containing protein [Dichotomopilus funicola]|uniref:Ctf8-domain-containing protein n=1 Tax=Dichotomopilus funicola TaxID=1934379 RepID=A0AAN6UX77_9PEZI|nr:Ctf8-domain-containing protein [Dichotomopilus funicola]
MSSSTDPQHPEISIPLHPRPLNPLTTSPPPTNPLPTLLQTPSGLALLELQGSINLPPSSTSSNNTDDPSSTSPTPVPIGTLHFPDYHAGETPDGDTAWMRRVWMYVGEHQMLHGEVKKLPKAVAVLRKRGGGSGGGGGEEEEEGRAEELEVAGVVKYKIVFSSRPEPVRSGVGL